MGPRLLQLEAKAFLLHLENGEVVLLHQIDDGFDVFKFQAVSWVRKSGRLGKVGFASEVKSTNGETGSKIGDGNVGKGDNSEVR